jgi:cation:H+ antiporter
MLLWLGELGVSSFFLSRGAEGLSGRFGAKFVGLTLLSIATTLPEIAIVVSAAASGSYGTAIGAGLGSNLLMMTLGLAIMLLIATTRLSKLPQRRIDVSMFKVEKLFLLVTAVASAVLFLNGYSLLEGILFSGLFIAYLIVAVMRMRKEVGHIRQSRPDAGHRNNNDASKPTKVNSQNTVHTVVYFIGGTAGIFLGASPFVSALQGFSLEAGVSVVVLAVIISPIAGEMPEKISMMLLARRGGTGASMAVANVLGSKILNNTLLLAIAVFAATFHGGLYTVIPANVFLLYQMILVTSITIAAVVPMLRQSIGLKTGILLASLYVVGISVQFLLPQDLKLH